MMTKAPFSQSPLHFKSIKRLGLPKDPQSKLSTLESGELVYVGWDGKLFALDAEDGSTKWSRTLRRFGLNNSTAHQIDMMIQSGILYAIWGDRIFELNPGTGQVLEVRRTSPHALAV